MGAEGEGCLVAHVMQLSLPLGFERCSQPSRHDHARCCRGREVAARACLFAYCSPSSSGAAAAAATASPPLRLPAWWPGRPTGITLSYVAMCYTLLHELEPLHDVFKARPELWEAASLREVQAAAWGWLDEMLAGLH